MKPNQLTISEKETASQSSLSDQIAQLKDELDKVSNQVNAFEALLRSHLTYELITEQELSVLYKAQKAEKKARRFHQKQKGKNYVKPVGLKSIKRSRITESLNEDELKERKRLYREAMMQVHPDKFSMNNEKMDLATELTARLIEIYKHESLATLKAYHAHLFSNTELTEDSEHIQNQVTLAASHDAYLIKEKERLEQSLSVLKRRHIYHVLTTYRDPSTFVNELRSYYQGRIAKLRKRTRTKD